MARFSVRFLGCKVSQADALLIRDALSDAGHLESAEADAQVRIVNTCALTVGAEKKSRKQVNRAARGARTFVTGCAANLNPGQFGDTVTVLPASAERAAAEIVEALGGVSHACVGEQRRSQGRTRAFVKVQNGCDYACAFCIIPRTRGVARSRPLEAVLRDARRRIAEGHPELVLTGINIGTWRGPGGEGLPALIRAVGALEGLRRLRVSSIEPGDLTDDLFGALAELEVAAPHLHVPLQSGDDRVLREMRRHHDVAEYLSGVERARDRLPGLNLTTDVIVGFPGEDERAFEGTMRVAERLGMSKIHVFPYSPRPGAPAAAMAGGVEPAPLKERAARMRELSDRLGLAYRRDRIGQSDRVLVESRLQDGTLSGLGADYSRFVLPDDLGSPGRISDVVVAGVAGHHLLGEAA